MGLAAAGVLYNGEGRKDGEEKSFLSVARFFCRRTEETVGVSVSVPV